ncbi:5-formyltetrahydrofolate cyclo-ligase [Secundilactobacillus kimchicus]|uniref:5-formyltetrahydrofolate cyclo-ligase n=1 Tax=Secundilactobacillus kimchicus TaxID=528209 RepID=UPI001C01B3BD|nr:5-formyltetrahydrofolate cyclo-ligase [Secundilactobacillus kimchicus]MBT9672794.1 5-formyltetrahydrofolate cyclo-ligase [Secundilactobacillus kimchicus]
MTKKAWRNEIVQALHTLDPNIKQSAEAALYTKLFETAYWQSSRTIGITLSTELELATGPIIEQATLDHKQVVIPKTLPNWQMAFYPFTETTELAPTKFGIQEPITGDPVDKSDIDLIVVPGLGFTPKGFRLGFGGGYYDRFLADYSGTTVVLALPVQTFEQPEWPVKNHDIVIDHVLTV